MGKLQNVTAEQLKAAQEKTWDLSGELADLGSRIEKGYTDEIAAPLEFVTTFLSLSRTAADLAAHILVKARLQEQKAETQKVLEARTKKS